MKYKALMLDVDGTLIRYSYDAVPSDKVAEAIKKAKEKVSIFLVTGRALHGLMRILEKLELTSGLMVSNGGAVIVDIATKKIIAETPIVNPDLGRVIKVFLEEGVEFWIKDDPLNTKADKPPFKQGDSVEKAYMFYTDEVHDMAVIDKLRSKLSKISNLTIHTAKHALPDKYGLNITHAKATKLHGITLLMEKTGLKREEIIGVGDGYNDFPLLMASGLKVAMGNAFEDLKAIADYIAPSVDDDGVADVIEKFILKEQ
jgi:Cof subfamily protein (haloacid dehalogenase superfamily)